MGTRLELHDEFIDIMGTRDNKESQVYFQPPESKKMIYPCIRYELAAPDLRRANNKLYAATNRYEIMVIDYDPESEIPGKILRQFPMCSPGIPFVKDNLYHTPLTLYY